MHDQDLLRVLHAVRLAGINGADAVVERSEVGASRVASVLTEAQASGWVEQRVVVRDRRPSGWMLTAQGRRHGEALLAAEVALAGAAEALVAAGVLGHADDILFAELREIEEEIKREMEKARKAKEEAAAKKQLQTISNVQAEARYYRAHYLFEVSKVLTPEQKTKLHEMLSGNEAMY